jgi:hypothetical protein
MMRVRILRNVQLDPYARAADHAPAFGAAFSRGVLPDADGLRNIDAVTLCVGELGIGRIGLGYFAVLQEIFSHIVVLRLVLAHGRRAPAQTGSTACAAASATRRAHRGAELIARQSD